MKYLTYSLWAVSTAVVVASVGMSLQGVLGRSTAPRAIDGGDESQGLTSQISDRSALSAPRAMLTGGPRDASMEVNTNMVSDNGWYSLDTRSSRDIDGASADGINLNGINNTDRSYTDPPIEGVAGHDELIDKHIVFGPPPISPPPGEHQSAVQLIIGNAIAGKATIGRIDIAGLAPGWVFADPGFHARYSWMGQGDRNMTAALKVGFATSEATSAPTLTGKSLWDKLLIYEPTNGNGGEANGTWIRENLTASQGRWWLVDRIRGGATSPGINNPLTLDEWKTSTLDYNGTPFSTIFGIITDSSSKITTVQFGVGSSNARANVFVNEFEANWYQNGKITTFGTPIGR